MMDDTIAGVSTAVGNAGISIIRMSGPDAFIIAEKVFKGKIPIKNQLSHTIQYGRIVSIEGVIDEVLLSKMAEPRTYTCEDIIEINCHGGYVVTSRILSLLISFGARPAEPGEFTKRAFINGRIDLSQAEAVMDVIQARSAKGSQIALKQLEGRLSEKVTKITSMLIDTLAKLEVNLDYPEYDVEELSREDVKKATGPAIEELSQLIKSFHYGKILREGMDVVIMGKPNVGKSSLMNRLSRKNRSIVTEIPGTTRDAIEEYINLSGIPIKLTDTAGVRETSDLVESIGVERSVEALKKSDIAILLFDASDYPKTEDKHLYDLVSNHQDQFIVVFNKCDLVQDPIVMATLEVQYPDSLFVSVVKDEGIGLLESKLIEFATLNALDIDNQVLVTNARHEHQLRLSLDALHFAVKAVDSCMTLDVIALELKTALEELGRITGQLVSKDIIDAIFSRFCLGK